MRGSGAMSNRTAQKPLHSVRRAPGELVFTIPYRICLKPVTFVA